ncbi:glycosyltransferase family 39 protein [Ideonella sp. DXS22W]|uniref:Glycosyltransferase family 39 protein n=1 Tax=Pseudaquabacterium inlustre TaxID=2984192 RepID=A0ABU9CK49_9BURK
MSQPPFLQLPGTRVWQPGLRQWSEQLAGQFPRAGVLLAWLVLWLVWTGLSTQSPPVDNAEQLSWVRSLEWGYYKHPPLPTVLLWPFVQVLGLTETATYAAAAAVNLASLLILHRLLLRLTGARQALLALLATLCVGYYSLRLAYFNHDTLLMLAHLAGAWCVWHAFAAHSHSGRRLAWWGLGLALGLGALAKYQVSLTAGAAFVFWVLRQGWRQAEYRRGLAEAAVIALAVVSPHLLWLVNHDFQPFDYARQNALTGRHTRVQCSVDAMRWVGDQLAQLAGPLLLGLGLQLDRLRRGVRAWGPVAMGWRRGGDAAPAGPGEAASGPSGVGALLFCFGLLPLLWMPLMAVMLNARMHMNWGTAFMPLTCAALIHFSGAWRWQRVRLAHALAGFVLVQAVLAAWAWQQHRLPRPVFSQHRSSQFDSQRVADAIGPQARAAIGGPVRVIAGRQRLVSVLALRLPERPLVLVDGRPELSPWLPEDLSALCAVLWVGDAGDRPPAAVQAQAVPGGQGLWWGVEVLSERVDRCPAAALAVQRRAPPAADPLADSLGGL